ncbi:MAG: hypothetical protein P8Y23_12485, partial [Candidatus Lokiarchaeota archaeon]
SRILILVTFLLLSIEIIFIVVTFFIMLIVINDVVVIHEISFGTTVIPESAIKFIFSGLLIFLEIALIFSSVIMWYNYKETKSF